MWIVYSLVATLSAAVVVTLSKAGLKNVDSTIGFAVQPVLILSVSWIVVFSQGTYKELSQIEGKAWFYLIAAGIITWVSSLMSFRALKLGEASQVSSFDKISLVFSIILAAAFLKERLTLANYYRGIDDGGRSDRDFLFESEKLKAIESKNLLIVIQPNEHS